MDLPSSAGWYSWSALKGGRARKPFRLSASVDSIPYADNDFFSSVGSLTNFPDYEDDGSVNNILDAAGLTASWSILDGVGTTNSVVAKGDNESSGLGSAGTNSASPTGSSVPQNEDYEHVYCQLDPYFSPPTLNINKSQQQGNTRASLRSWGRSATMEKDPGIIPFLQHALLLRYREILNIYMQQTPAWCPTHYLEDVYPTVYQVVPSIYGTSSSEIQHDTYKPILPHQIFAKMSEDDNSRVFWLEGEAGSGKTLFCSKILSEWVAHNSYDYTNTPLNTRIGEFQVVFYVPLREVRSSLSRFLLQDLIPKRSILKRMKPAHVCKCLNLLGRSMLLILDGLDDCSVEVLKEAEDILNGQMFPQSLVLLTSRPMMPLDNSLMMNGHVRKYLVNGMHNTQIMCFMRRYFTGRKFRTESQLADILSDRPDLFSLASNPLMCLLLCSVYEEVGDLPSNAELYLCLIRSLIYQNGLMKVDTNSSCKDNKTIPLKYEDALKSFGKLALHKLGDNSVQYSEAEVSQYCQNFEILKCGVLTKWKGFFRKTTKKSSAYTLKLLHPSFNTFLAAYYLASTVNTPSIFRRDMELLPGFELLQECQVCSDNIAFTVLQLVMELLQENSFVAFSTLSLMDISLNYLLALLRSAGFYESNVRTICSLTRSLKHLCIQNQNQRWLSEIKQVLASSQCPFQSLEIVIKPGFSLCRLMEGLLLNKSISQVKFTSIPGQDWSEIEVNLICGQFIQLLIDKKLKCLEISMTCLDMEDKEHSRFQAIVDSLCYVLSKQIPLQKLVLDMDLTSLQLQQLASYIKCHTYIQILQLPHLGCGPEGMRAISSCLPLLSSLNLAGTWRSNDDVDVIEPTPFYSSLSRGPLNGTLKSPSIRRKKLNQLTEDDKRNSDTALFQRNFLPLPICDQANHELDGFHAIFSGLRNFTDCKLHSLDISKCVLNWEDVICLGETIRKATCLESLRMEGMKLCDVLPVLLGIQENESLKMVHLSSPHVVISDDTLQLACQSLSQNRTLRLLAVQGWTFYIEEEKSLECLETLFASTNLVDLDLTNVRVHISSTSKTQSAGNGLNNSDKNSMISTLEKKSRKDVKQGKEKSSSMGCRGIVGKKSSISSVMSLNGGVRKIFPNLSFLRIGGMHVEFGKSQMWRSMDIISHLLPFVDKGKITHIDLSLMSIKSDSNFIVEDKVMMKTVKLIGQSLPKLQRLVLQHWRIKMSEKSSKEIGKYLSGLDSLSSINMDHCTVNCDTAGNSTSPSKRIDHLLISSILSNVKNLSDFSWANFDSIQMPQLARVLCDHHHNVVPTMGLTVKLDSVPLSSFKILINNSHVKNNSTSSPLVIEYIGNNSVIVRKSKDKGDHLMHKLKKLL